MYPPQVAPRLGNAKIDVLADGRRGRARDRFGTRSEDAAEDVSPEEEVGWMDGI